MENGIARGADIAVIGAAGKTGEAVVAALPPSVTVRRLVRKARVDGDFEVELETGSGLRKALAGCRGVYFIAPNRPSRRARTASQCADGSGIGGSGALCLSLRRVALQPVHAASPGQSQV